MALDNYDNLKQSIKLWSHREDIVGEIANDCVTIAEQEIFYGANPIRITEMLSEQISAVSTKTFAFPPSMLELVAISIEDQGIYYRLQNIPIQDVRDDDNSTGRPTAYAMTDQFVFDIEPDKSYNIKFEYYLKPTALSDSNTTNIILTKYPTIYLFGGVAAAFMYSGEDDKFNEFTLRMRDVIGRANSEADNIRYGAVPTTFIDGVTP